MNLVKLAKGVGRAVLRTHDRQDAIAELQRRFGSEPRLPSTPIQRVLVICHGNICRSPFAAASLARQLPSLEVRSAGLFAGSGNPADGAALRVARQFGIDLKAHRSGPIDQDSLAGIDLVLGMEGRHRAELIRRYPDTAPRVRLLGHHLSSAPFTLPDPWGHPDEVLSSRSSELNRPSCAWFG